MPKRKRGNAGGMSKRRRIMRRRRKSRYSKLRPRTRFAKAIKRVLLKNSETKVKQFSVAQNTTLEHNELTVLNTNMLTIGQGSGDEERDGQEVYCRGIKLKFHFENQQYYPIARYDIKLIRNRVSPNSAMNTGDNIWEGISTSKQLDWVDKESWIVRHLKTVIVKQSASGSSRPLGDTVPGVADVDHLGSDYEVIGNAQRYVNIWIPFNRRVRYRDATSDPMDGKWNLCVLAYGPYGATTSSAVWPIGHCTGVAKLYFKDP